LQAFAVRRTVPRQQGAVRRLVAASQLTIYTSGFVESVFIHEYPAKNAVVVAAHHFQCDEGCLSKLSDRGRNANWLCENGF